MQLYRSLIRPILFKLLGRDAEDAHEYTLRLLALLSRLPIQHLYGPHDARLARDVCGVRFPNPVGLAAGMDKNGVALPAWAALGFGFVEVGTVTWMAQPGNPRPRLYRLVEDEALINRMGFNNQGALALAHRLARLGNIGIPLGISLGKSKLTAIEEAEGDYRASLRALYHHGDYFAINISSPNTAGLRALQDRAQLDALLMALQSENRAQSVARSTGPRPLLVKVAPDLSDSALAELLAVCEMHRISGIIATNTTLRREALRHSNATLAAQSGGLSGRPLFARALEVVRFIARESAGRLPIVGVGGLYDADDALRMFDAGASLVQLYSGLVYQGPLLPRHMNRALLDRETTVAVPDATPR
jgi:dihydroorotate dehydrogenase